MDKFLDAATKLCESGFAEQFVLDSNDSWYTPQYCNLDDMLSFTKLGSYLLHLGGCIDDKESPAMRICMGFLAFKGNHKVVYDNTTMAKSALLALHQLKETGDTNLLVYADAVTSGVGGLGSVHRCTTTLTSCLGSPKTALQALYTKPADVYTSTYNDFKRSLKPSERESLPNGLTRNFLKNKVIIPQLYGAGTGTIRATFDNDKYLTSMVLRALYSNVPALEVHGKLVDMLDYSGLNKVEWEDMLGRTAHFIRDEQVGYDISTSLGDVLIHANRPLQEGNQYYDGGLPAKAHIIHNWDSTIIATLVEEFSIRDKLVLSVHDAAMTLGGKDFNTMRTIYTDCMARTIVEKSPMETFLKDVFDIDVEFPTDNVQDCLDIIQNSHLAII